MFMSLDKLQSGAVVFVRQGPEEEPIWRCRRLLGKSGSGRDHWLVDGIWASKLKRDKSPIIGAMHGDLRAGRSWPGLKIAG
jgi:hypothetical protein